MSAGNAGDASVAEDLIADLLDEHDTGHDTDTGEATDTGTGTDGVADEVVEASDTAGEAAPGSDSGQAGDAGSDAGSDQASVYGDNAYGTGQFHDRLDQAGIESKCKTQQPVAAGGLFSKDRFDIDLEQDSVTCPAGNTAPIRRGADGAGTATSARPAPAARCASSAPRPLAGAASASARMSSNSPTHGTGSMTRTGSPTTAPPDPKWNARSGT